MRAPYRKNPHTTQSGGDAIWYTTRIAVYLRDGFTCHYCGEVVLVGETASLDHIDPGWNNDPTNLITCCRTCNSSRKNTKLEPNERARARSQARKPLDRETARELAFLLRPAHRARAHRHRS